jgi:hypothetical protein
MSALAAREVDYVRKRIEALQAVVAEPVMGALAVSRRGLYTQKLMGRAGFLPWLLARAFAKRQAGGLPQQFMVAITPDKVRAFRYRARGRRRDRVEVGEEVAAWDRGALMVTWTPGPPYQLDVTIETGGEKMLLRCGRGQSSEDALSLMAEGAA